MLFKTESKFHVSPRDDTSDMHAAMEIHMHESATDVGSDASRRSMETMQTTNCRMEGDAAMECERLAASSQASSDAYKKRMEAGGMMQTTDNIDEKTMESDETNWQKTVADAMTDTDNMKNAASGVRMECMMGNRDAIDSDTMARLGCINAFHDGHTRMDDEAVSGHH